MSSRSRGRDEIDLAAIASSYLALSRRWRCSGDPLSARDIEAWDAYRSILERALGSSVPREPRTRRRWIRIPTLLTIGFASGSGWRDGDVTEISDGGMFIRTDSPLDEGSIARIRLPPAPSGSVLEVPGIVVWNRLAARRGRPPGMAIRFDLLDPAQAKRLLDLVEEALVERLALRATATKH